jgi:hypothetical protein
MQLKVRVQRFGLIVMVFVLVIKHLINKKIKYKIYLLPQEQYRAYDHIKSM